MHSRKIQNCNNVLYLFVGPSGSGKDTICDTLASEYGFKKIKSYTTRKRRYLFEKTHKFISDKKFSKLKDICAYTEYAGYKYCATKTQIDKCNLYIIDPEGINYLKLKYNGGKKLYIIYVETPSELRLQRMINRGDKSENIETRVMHDNNFDYSIKSEADFILYNTKDLNSVIKDFLIFNEVVNDSKSK